MTAKGTGIRRDEAIDFNTNHAKSPLAGVQWIVEAPKDFPRSSG